MAPQTSLDIAFGPLSEMLGNHWYSCIKPWVSAHRGKLGQLTPWKMDEKLKSENMQNRAVFYVYVIF